jgi:hypothetical protein
MQKIINTLVFFMVIIFFMTTCDKDGPVEDIPVIPEDTTFCGYIHAEKFDSTYRFLNQILSKIPFDEDSMKKFEKRLIEENCVVEVEWICNSCLFSLPAQSEVLVRIKTNQGFIRVVIRVVMMEPMKSNGMYKL